jgi:peptidoglycan/LPS O-acetylase OafA/YrhL
VLVATAAWSLLLIVAGHDGDYPGFGAAVRAGHSMPIVGWIYLAFSNVFIFGQDLSLYLHLAGDRLAWTSDFRVVEAALYRFQLVPQAWSIALELVFYGLAPFLIRLRLRSLWIIVAASVGVRLWLAARGLDHDPWRYRFLPAELALFVLGIVAYKSSAFRWPRTSRRTGWLQLAALLAFVLAYGWLPGNTAKYVTFCVVTAATIPAVFRVTERVRWDRYVGELSYPIYLTHLLLFEVVARLRLGVNGTRSAGIVVTLVCSAVLYEVVQKRIDRVRSAHLSLVGEQTVIP